MTTENQDKGKGVVDVDEDAAKEAEMSSHKTTSLEVSKWF